MRLAIVDGLDVRDSRVHIYSPRWSGAPSQDLPRPARMALALFGLAGAGVLGVILGVVREAGWLI